MKASGFSLVHELHGHVGPIVSLAVSRDYHIVVTGSADGMPSFIVL
jgi:hypothetical protein